MPDPAAAAKTAAARAAVGRVRAGSRLGLGTGSTAALAIRALAERFPDGGQLECVASSVESEHLAHSLGVPVGPLRPDFVPDLMIDGADELGPSLGLTKGGGGALLREKLLARLAREMWVIVDDSKIVRRLGTRHPIPVEVVPFARPVLVGRWTGARLNPVRRLVADGSRPFLTDNGNEIVDLAPDGGVDDPGRLDQELHAEVGVVETGLFLGIAKRAFIGTAKGNVEERVAPTTG